MNAPQKQPPHAILREIWSWLWPALLAAAIVLVVRIFFFEFTLVRGASMNPSFQNGEFLISEKLSYRSGAPQYGDVVVLRCSFERRHLIKRVVGRPGDRLYARDGVLYRNGSAVDEPYVLEKMSFDFGPVHVPADCYYVLGDNRNNSEDSRFFGWIPAEDILARSVFRLWPPARMGLLE